MGDNYSYDNLATYLGNMTDEAINSMMSLVGFHGSVESGFEGTLGGGGGSSWVRIGPLGGRYEGSTFTPGGQVIDATPGSPVYGQPIGMTLADVFIGDSWPFTNVQALIDYFTNGIMDLFNPWWQMPRPEGFDAQIQRAQQAADLLMLSPASAHSDGGLDHGDDATLDLHRAMSDLDQSGHDLKSLNDDHGGAAMSAFWGDVADPIQLVLPSQGALATLVLIGAKGEQEIWKRTREALASIAGNGAEAMKSARGDGGGGFASLLKVVGALALVAAPFTDGLSLVGDIAVESVLNGAGVIGQTTADFMKEGETEQETPELGAGDPIGVLSNVKDALDKLSNQIKSEETRLQTGFDKVTAKLDPESRRLAWYQLGGSSFFTDDNSADFVNVISVRHHTLDVMGDDISDTISPTLGKASFAVLEAQDESAWQRPASIGLGAAGPYWSYAALASTTSTCLDNTQSILDQAASILHQMAKDFSATDDKVRSDLVGMTKTYNEWLHPAPERLPGGKVMPN